MKLLTLLLGFTTLAHAQPPIGLDGEPAKMYFGCGYLKDETGERVVIDGKRFDVECLFSPDRQVANSCDLIVIQLKHNLFMKREPLPLISREQEGTTFESEQGKMFIRPNQVATLTINGYKAKCSVWNH